MSEQENQIGVKGEIESESIVRNPNDEHISEKIILNVGGIKYETYRSTLTSHPQTLLGIMFHPRNRVMLHPTNGNEYFIDRNGYAFHYVMEYYRTGTIVWRPTLDLPCDHLPSPQSSSTPCTISPSQSNSYTEINNATVPTRAAAAIVAKTSSSGCGFLNTVPLQISKSAITPPPSNPAPPERSSCWECHNSQRPYVSLPELEQEFNYFQIPFTSR
ncbi:3855_t:CDS:2, partial [Acaulospora morrowiae]